MAALRRLDSAATAKLFEMNKVNISDSDMEYFAPFLSGVRGLGGLTTDVLFQNGAAVSTGKTGTAESYVEVVKKLTILMLYVPSTDNPQIGCGCCSHNTNLTNGA